MENCHSNGILDTACWSSGQIRKLIFINKGLHKNIKKRVSHREGIEVT